MDLRETVEIFRTQRVSVPNLENRIRAERQRLQNETGVSVTQIAANADMSVQNWYRIEKGAHSIPEETLRTIEEVLGVDFGVKFDD